MHAPPRATHARPPGMSTHGALTARGRGGGADPPTQAQQQDAQQQGAGGTLVRHVLATIQGNRALWENLGVHAALWRVSPERASAIFCADGAAAACDGGALLAADRLSRALIKRVTVLESHTNIEEVVAVSIDGLPPKEFTGSGDGASLFLTGEGRVTAPQDVFTLTGNTELGMAWMQQFPRYTADNLEEPPGAMLLAGTTYYFVHEEHPVVHMLRTGQHSLGVHIGPETLVEEHWYRIDVESFVYCVKCIRDTVLHNTPATFNLNTLTVRIAKPDGQKWLTFAPHVIDALVPDDVRRTRDAEAIQQAKVHAVQRYLDRPLFLTLRLAIEYALPDLGRPQLAAAA